MTDTDKAAFQEACAHLATDKYVISHAEKLVAQALACSNRRERPSERWEAEATQLLRLLQQDKRENELV